MFDSSLLNLPWATLVTLASGYIGYFIANVGLKDQHKTVDVTFSTLVFGLLSALAYDAAIHFGIYMATSTAVVIALASGALWRKYGRKSLYWTLRRSDVSWSDSTNSAWQQMFGHTDYRVYEVTVYLKSGTVLLSRNVAQFEGLPNGPCTFGNQGDIIIYVTHRRLASTPGWKEDKAVNNEIYGAAATYIPVDQISRLEIRRARK
ncbi:hypothetical protein ACIF2R_01525 [Serratia marcescens]|uniref:hypothetical protein n=1 Tax=Serratia marcescens TaxID=615 RepID=UPI0037D0F207